MLLDARPHGGEFRHPRADHARERLISQRDGRFRQSQVFGMPSASAQALATALSGEVLPIIVAQPPLAMKSP